jgi:RimJ/RimL family protein N-acetyltransferase
MGNAMITKEGLTLRRFYEEDRRILVQLADNPNVVKYLAPRFPNPYRLEDADAWIALTREEKQPLNFAIEWQGKLVGGIGIEPSSGLFVRTAELGYWLGESFWGRGLAAKAVELFTPYVFCELPFIRMQAFIFAENRNSMRVLEKNGFTKEGTLRKHITKNGMVTDAILYAKLASE